MPKRIQRKRTKGWKMPPNTVNCTRPGPYGNPFKIGFWYLRGDASYLVARDGYQEESFRKIENAEQAVEWFLWWVGVRKMQAKIRSELRGKDLSCWCHLCEKHKDGLPLGSECTNCALCHVNVLLEIANA